MGVLKNLEQCVNAYLLTFLLCCIPITFCDVLRGEKEGYYAFEEAPSRLMRPPQVRKPPYMMSSIPCATGENSYSKRPSPKNTLCGDLNKGFIPLNPLGQEFDGQPYPFELIKNKTLLFLSKSLPYLKQDPKIPKVSKISGKKSAHVQSNSNSHEYQWPTSTPYRIKRSTNESTNATANDIPDILDNETTARQNCDQGGASGLLCSLSSAMSNNKIPLALISAVAQNFLGAFVLGTQQRRGLLRRVFARDGRTAPVQELSQRRGLTGSLIWNSETELLLPGDVRQIARAMLKVLFTQKQRRTFIAKCYLKCRKRKFAEFLND
ncbi:uncharacterized protein NPIL_55261 [Nephila pilipes]|uniref:Uncharacterized protein n=1 Tax=Nephila pilipes TaxID=299642 RepID=A0A8X6QBF1_NEPPI|nr:uncharacterized protein NPIL_55261 [Nephila pilipes]